MPHLQIILVFVASMLLLQVAIGDAVAVLGACLQAATMRDILFGFCIWYGRRRTFGQGGGVATNGTRRALRSAWRV